MAPRFMDGAPQRMPAGTTHPWNEGVHRRETRINVTARYAWDGQGGSMTLAVGVFLAIFWIVLPAAFVGAILYSTLVERLRPRWQATQAMEPPEPAANANRA